MKEGKKREEEDEKQQAGVLKYIRGGGTCTPACFQEWHHPTSTAAGWGAFDHIVGDGRREVITE